MANCRAIVHGRRIRAGRLGAIGMICLEELLLAINALGPVVLYGLARLPPPADC